MDWGFGFGVLCAPAGLVCVTPLQVVFVYTACGVFVLASFYSMLYTRVGTLIVATIYLRLIQN